MRLVPCVLGDPEEDGGARRGAALVLLVRVLAVAALGIWDGGGARSRAAQGGAVVARVQARRR